VVIVEHRLLLAGMVLVSGCWGLQFVQRPVPPEITFLAVGQGDCVLIRDGNHTVLVDAGPISPSGDAGERLVVPDLQRRGVRRIDYVLLSHPDLDHSGGLGAILRAYPGTPIVVPSTFRNDSQLLSQLRSAGVHEERIAWLQGQSLLRCGEWKLMVWCPERFFGASDNDGSMFVRADFRGSSAILTGDASSEVESRAPATMDWRGELLKAGHHGSAGSTSGAWLDRVRPKWVVASSGRTNIYGHPSAALLDRCRPLGCEVLRTDHAGSITFTPNAGGGFDRSRDYESWNKR
jgi:competence protein ComEC